MCDLKKYNMLKHKLFLPSIIAIFLFGILLFTSVFFQRKIAYIDFTEVYNGFKYKLELEKDFEKVVKARQHILDSLKYQLTIKGSSKDTSGYNILLDQYSYNKRVFEHNNNLLQEEYYNKIVKQLNQYVFEFGDENGYDFIFGANGNGSLMYGNKGKNISDKVIIYINEKFDGK